MGQHAGIEMKAIFLRTHRNLVKLVGKIPHVMQNPPTVTLSVVYCVFQYSCCLPFPSAKPMIMVFHKQLRNAVIHKYR